LRNTPFLSEFIYMGDKIARVDGGLKNGIKSVFINSRGST
jgi:hypothetical protein